MIRLKYLQLLLVGALYIEASEATRVAQGNSEIVMCYIRFIVI